MLSPTPAVAAVWAPTGIEAIEGRAKDPPPFSGPLLNPGPSLIQVLLYLESAMEALVGRDVEILRSVFSEDVARGMSLDPPEGRSSWKGTITELEDKKFTVSLETCACIEGIFPIDCP